MTMKEKFEKILDRMNQRNLDHGIPEDTFSRQEVLRAFEAATQTGPDTARLGIVPDNEVPVEVPKREGDPCYAQPCDYELFYDTDVMQYWGVCRKCRTHIHEQEIVDTINVFGFDKHEQMMDEAMKQVRDANDKAKKN